MKSGGAGGGGRRLHCRLLVGAGASRPAEVRQQEMLSAQQPWQRRRAEARDFLISRGLCRWIQQMNLTRAIAPNTRAALQEIDRMRAEQPEVAWGTEATEGRAKLSRRNRQ